MGGGGDRKYRFRTHRSVFVGKEMVDAMVIAGLVETRQEAVRLGRVLAKKYNFFQNIENNIMNKTIPFADSASKFYRFSAGALWVLRDPADEGEGNDDITASTTSTSSTEDEGSSIDNSATKKQTPPLPRQTATRHLIVKESDVRSSVMDVSVFKKKQQSTKSKTLNKKTMPMMQAAMQAIVEDENEDAQTATTSCSSSSNSTTEIERLKEISTLARIQAAFEIEARGLP